MLTFQLVLATATTATASGPLVAGKHTPVDATSGARTMTLPTPANVGARLRVEKIDASTNLVTITGTIRGATTTLTLLGQYDQLEFAAESTSSWRIVAQHRPKGVNDALYESAVNHGSNASTARPASAVSVLWVGTVQPSNMTAADVWVNPSATPTFSDLGPPTAAVSMGGQEVQNVGAPQSSASAATRGYVDTAVAAVTTASSVNRTLFSATVNVVPSATINTYGTVVTVNKDSGAAWIVPIGIIYSMSGVATETYKLQVTAHYSDGTSQIGGTNSASANTANISFGAAQLYPMFIDGKTITSITFQAQSTIANSTATGAVTVYGTQP